MNNCRTDLLTRKIYPKDQLIRFVISHGGIVVGENYKTKGRGYYVHPQSLQDEKLLFRFRKYLKREIRKEELECLKSAIIS